MKKWKRINRLAAVFLCLSLLAGCGSADGETGAAEVLTAETGENGTVAAGQEDRIVAANRTVLEEQPELPWRAGEVRVGEILEDEQGRILLLGMDGSRCISEDGKEWKQELDEGLADFAGEREMLSVSMSPSGYLAAAAVRYELEELDQERVFGEQYITCYYREPGLEGSRISMTLEPDQYLAKMWVSDQGGLYCQTNSEIYEVDRQSGRKTVLFETDGFAAVCMSGNIIYAADREQAYRYDCDEKTLLEQDSVLDEFIAQKAVSETSGFRIARGEGKACYLLCEDGLYRHIFGGTSIEQVMEGTIALNGCAGLLVPGPGMYYVAKQNGGLIRYFYGESDGQEKTEITVYRLMQETDASNFSVSRDMEAAIKKYSQVNPHVEVRYEIGMLEDSAAAKEDVIKNLNMRLMAGTGPDILILDGLPVDSYLEKQILLDISESVSRVDREEGILPQILGSYTEEDGSVYRIPLGFTVNVIGGAEEFVTKRNTLADYVDGMEHPQADSWFPYIEHYAPYMLESIAPSCMSSWITQDGEIREDSLLAFMENMKRLSVIAWKWDTRYTQGLEENPAATLEMLKENQGGYEEIDRYLTQNGYCYDGRMRPYLRHDDTGNVYSYVSIGQVGGWSSAVLSNVYDLYDRVEDYAVAQFNGQSENTFNPKVLTGVSVNSGEKEAALAFLEFLLSDQCGYGSQHLGDNESQYDMKNVFPVNRKTMEREKLFWEKTYGEDGLDITEISNQLQDIIDRTERPAVYQPLLMELVIENGTRVMWGDSTPEQAVSKIKSKMDLYMAE